MQLSAKSTIEFIKDAMQHSIAKKLGNSYDDYLWFRPTMSDSASCLSLLTALGSLDSRDYIQLAQSARLKQLQSEDCKRV